ncbi:MAG: LamG domain-containing protein, partial [Thermoproteota archaeon]
STNFAPKAPPGACQVFRPNGPGTTSFINLEGVCNGELPEYVATFIPGIYGQNGTGTMIRGPGLVLTGSAWTVSAWVYSPNPSGIGRVFGQESNYGTPSSSCDEFIFQVIPNLSIVTYGSIGSAKSTTGVSPNKWQMISASASGGTSGTVSFYINGQFISSNSLSTQVQTGSNWGWNIGAQAYCSGTRGAANGSIANVQLYNTSLSASAIQALYQEGIGGAPINLQNLVGWWPLNGNANDYSGNGNNGVPSNVMFVSNWYSGYTPP